MFEKLDRAASGAGSDAVGADQRSASEVADGTGSSLQLLRQHRADEGERPTRCPDDARARSSARGFGCALPRRGARPARRGLGGSRQEEKAPTCDARVGTRLPHLALARTRKRLEQKGSRGDHARGGALSCVAPRHPIAEENTNSRESPMYEPLGNPYTRLYDKVGWVVVRLIIC